MEKYDEQMKFCNCCKKYKPINEFRKQKKENNIQLYNSKCKVCEYLQKYNNNLKSTNEWSMEEYLIILDKILNQRIKIINEILPYLNQKDIFDLLKLLTNQLIIKGGNYIIKAILECEKCGNKFEIVPSRYKSGKYHFCSSKCRQESSKQRVKFICEYCGKETETTKSGYNKSKNHFCSNKCADKYRTKNAKEIRICEMCKKEYECFKTSNQRFCSNHCQGIWQSKTLVGENANGYNHDVSIEDRTYICEYCGKEGIAKINQIKKGRKFCSNECRQKWYSEVFSQSKEWKEVSKIRATKILTDGLISKINTNPQKIVNNILNELNIKYDNEYNCKYFAMDNVLFLNDDNILFIEVMGTYWHTDPRIYKEISYKMQRERIYKDKSKHSYIKNKYNVEILYLWEEDLNNNKELCENLIQQYIKNNGELINYHSFNYCLNKSNKLEINKNLIVPYIELTSEDVNKITNIKVTLERSKKQLDKWTIFKCEYCEKEHEQLTSHYKKSKTHCCSIECANKLRQRNRNNIK